MNTKITKHRPNIRTYELNKKCQVVYSTALLKTLKLEVLK